MLRTKLASLLLVGLLAVFGAACGGDDAGGGGGGGGTTGSESGGGSEAPSEGESEDAQPSGDVSESES